MGRRRAGIIAVTLVAAVVVAAWGSWLVGELTPRADGQHQTTGPTSPRPPGVPDDAEAAIVDRVVDGDTLRVIAAPGTSIPDGGSVRVRLLNIDTPELARDGQPAECGGPEAAARLAELVGPGDLVWLAADREDRDRYDRPLRAVWTDTGVLVNELLAEEGYAEALLIPPNDRFHARVEAAVARAASDGRGIWGRLCPR